MGLIKSDLNSDKLRGGYYTPKPIADFLCKWAIDDETGKVLEPSCGDGNFIESAILRMEEVGRTNDEISQLINGVELIEEEASKAKNRAEGRRVDPEVITNKDFFTFMKENQDKYDVVLGNPPFIRYQNFPEEHRTLAIEMMKDLGMKPNKLTNIWVPFLIISASRLNDNGKMAMVIPAELFQVKYAAESRIFLSKFFQRITIVTFKRLVFKGILQEVVLLLCEKKVSEAPGIRVLECENLEDLEEINFEEVNAEEVKAIEHTSEKWTKYFLDDEEIKILRNLKDDERIISCGDLMEVDVGLVTGRNDFFMLSKSKVEDWGLNDYVIPVVSKSNQLKGLTLTMDDFENNSHDQNSVYLFLPPKEVYADLPEVCKKYIKFGESQDYHTGYKCRIRKLWYVTPSQWSPGGFALRQVGDYPKIVSNDTLASSTDTIHRVRFKEGVDKNLLSVLFMNSLSLAFSEITGRSYGGGVMTFEPTEIEEIRIPRLLPVNLDYEKIDNLVRERKIEQVLDIVDQEFLIKGHGFTSADVLALRNVWRKLSNRRLARSKSKK